MKAVLGNSMPPSSAGFCRLWLLMNKSSTSNWSVTPSDDDDELVIPPSTFVVTSTTAESDVHWSTGRELAAPTTISNRWTNAADMLSQLNDHTPKFNWNFFAGLSLVCRSSPSNVRLTVSSYCCCCFFVVLCFWLFCLCGWVRIDGIHFPPLARVVLLCSLGGGWIREEKREMCFLFFNKKKKSTHRERETEPTKKNVRERAERFKMKNQMKRDAMENEWERKRGGKKKREGLCCLVLLQCKRQREREPEQFDCDCVDQMWHGPAFILLSSLHMSGPKGGGAALRRLPDALPFSSTIRSSSSLLLGVLCLLFHFFSIKTTTTNNDM